VSQDQEPPLPQKFPSGGIDIAFVDEGQGHPVLLIHGFGSNHRVNWVSTSWTRDLLAARRRVIALDNRGHGESSKPHDPAAYRISLMADDSRRLLDHLGVENADVIGYSMGARIALSLALAHSERVRSLVLGGFGDATMKRELFSPAETIIAALRAPSLAEITDPRGRTYRIFADQTGSDREALVACILGARDPVTASELQRIAAPTLVAVGSEDVSAGSAERLAERIPGARALSIPGRDHMKAVGDKAHKRAVLAFLAAEDARGLGR
jgi:pimeloyl-ACP methyl ester carboxylesterase